MKTKTSTQPEIFSRQQTILSLLTSHTLDNQRALEIADNLKTLLMITNIHQHDICESHDFIGTEEFHQTCATIDAVKIRLTQAILNY